MDVFFKSQNKRHPNSLQLRAGASHVRFLLDQRPKILYSRQFIGKYSDSAA
jgi:hypothetical protein